MQPETVALKAENKRNTSHHIQAKSETTKNYQNGSSDKFSHKNIRTEAARFLKKYNSCPRVKNMLTTIPLRKHLSLYFRKKKRD